MILGAIFDLDGVLVDTAKYHFLAWKKLADQLKIPFNEIDNERLKGVSRDVSLEILLSFGTQVYSQEEQQQMMNQKNQDYLKLIEKMSPKEVLPGVKMTLNKLKKANVKLALGSASKNAQTILSNVDLLHYFDEIVDGNDVQQGKPNPEVFLLAAKKLSLEPSRCVVFEDAHAGCQAAKAAHMYCIGVGSKENLPEADLLIQDFVDFDIRKVFET